MRTQHPHASSSQRDVVVPGGDLPADFDGTTAGRGLCCPDDPLDLVLQLFPRADRAPPPSSLAALGIGAAAPGEPPRPKQEPVESAYGRGGGGGGWDSWGLSSLVLEGLCGAGLDEIDVDMFFADDALDGGGEATEGNNLLCDDPTGAKPNPPAHITAAGGPVHTRGSLGGAGVPNDASPPPLPAPVPAGANFPLQAYDACRAALDAAVFINASPPTLPSVPAGSPPPVFVTSNSTPPLPALIMPAAPAPSAPMPPAAPAPMPAGGAPPVVVVTNNGTPPLPALMSPAAPAPKPPAVPAPMPAASSLHACAALPAGIVSNFAPAPPPPPLMALMPARALHPNAAVLAGVYSSINAPAPHAPPSAAPSSSSPPSRADSGPGRSTSSTTSETEFLAWAVPRKQRSPPAVNRLKRPWLLDFPLHALPPVVARPPPSDGNDDDDAKNQNAAILPVALAPPGNITGCGGDDIAAAGGGGVRRRRPAPRPRNRQAQRVCSHCHSPETPQWRAGPDGPGTLCNACGIRYAANRLLPEYRPSTAPSFRSGQHSNRHRNVMKLREQQMKEKEEKPPSEQSKEEKDDGFMGVCEYISAAGL